MSLPYPCPVLRTSWLAPWLGPAQCGKSTLASLITPVSAPHALSLAVVEAVQADVIRRYLTLREQNVITDLCQSGSAVSAARLPCL